MEYKEAFNFRPFFFNKSRRLKRVFESISYMKEPVTRKPMLAAQAFILAECWFFLELDTRKV